MLSRPTDCSPHARMAGGGGRQCRRRGSETEIGHNIEDWKQAYDCRQEKQEEGNIPGAADRPLTALQRRHG